MSSIAKILSFLRVTSNDANVSDVQIDTGGGNNITGHHYAPPGDDSFPLKTDYAVINSLPSSGSVAVTGYIDPINTPKAIEGDKRVYARDPETGVPINEVWLKNDGSVLVSNDNGNMLLRPDGSIKGDNGSGSFELEVGGNFVVNGVTIDINGNITSPATITGANIVGNTSVSSPSILGNSKELSGHIHLAGTVPGDTGPNI